MAAQFGHWIARRDDQAAWGLLTDEARAAHSPAALRAAVEAMIADAAGPIRQVQVIEEATVEAWPDQRPGDIAVVYVALSGDRFSEAVTLTLAHDAGQVRIRDLVWGRP
ncbi:MAG: hypothetical protein VKL58_04860 [Cyanobacteriota bacterium]|nr:hypothetical protein [Cyanobacteriota bacterium]